MKTTLKKWAGIFLIPFLFSCATITVNVYFPDKDVEAAFEDIESGLDFDAAPAPSKKNDTEAVKTKPKSKSRTEAFFGLQRAWADSKININAELKKMEAVQESLERRKERIETLVRLFEARLIGLVDDGTISRLPKNAVEGGPTETSDDVFGADEGETGLTKFIAAENRDRKILIRGMAIATLRATEQDEKDKEALATSMEKSQGIFAKQNLAKLRPGWFYQDESGSWKQIEPPEEETPEPKR